MLCKYGNCHDYYFIIKPPVFLHLKNQVQAFGVLYVQYDQLALTVGTLEQNQNNTVITAGGPGPGHNFFGKTYQWRQEPVVSTCLELRDLAGGGECLISSARCLFLSPL